MKRWRTADLFAEHTGISTSVIRDVETGRRAGRFRPATIAAIEDALDWTPGSYERASNGQRPTVRTDPFLARLQTVWPELSRDARSLLVEFAEAAHANRWAARPE